MATQTVYLASSVSGTCVNPGLAIGNTPTTWAGEANVNATWSHTWALTNPAEPTLAALQQSVTVPFRKGSNSNNPTVVVSVVRGGTTLASSASTTITSTTGQNVVVAWTPTAGESSQGVSVTVVMTAVGGSPTARNSAQLSMATWVVQSDVAAPSQNYNSAPSDNLGATDSVVAALNRSQTIADTLGGTDNLTRALSKTIAVTDTLGLSDSAIRNLARFNPRRLHRAVQVGYISAPPPVGSGDLGTVGNRPSLLAPPDATNTGPRQSSTQTLTGTQALAAVLAAPVEADGRRYLRRANITSTITFDSVEHTNIVFEDCTINHIGSYTVYGFYTGTVFPSGAMPEFRYCEITGGTASTIVGCSMRFLRCNIHRGEDIIKARETGGEVYACYLHSTYHEADSHSDIVQITSNAIDYLFHWNNMVALNSSDSPSGPGNWNNGVLQTGAATQPIGPVYWYDNWFDGGGYTIRTGEAIDLNGYQRLYTFRRNKFGTDSRWGPVLGPTTGDVDWDSSNVWAATGIPVI